MASGRVPITLKMRNGLLTRVGDIASKGSVAVVQMRARHEHI
jgi:hypothetical protein